MKTLSLLVALLVAGFSADAYASGYGAAVVQQNVVVRQRIRTPVLRQRIFQRQRIVQNVYAAPVYAAPIVQQSYAVQAVAVPYVQQVVVPQAVHVQSYVAPQVLQFKSSCALGAGCF
jgi:hypothetical protein